MREFHWRLLGIMQSLQFDRMDQHTEKLDADAVCSRCHAVNPDGALICHACGNNLRDQRAGRLEEEAMLLGHERGFKRKIAFRIFAGVAFCGLILMAMNPSAVTDWMTRVMTSAVPDGRVLWQGEDGPIFDGLAAELEARKPSVRAVRAAFRKPVRTLQTDGIYAISRGGQLAGYAIVRTQNGFIYIAATLANGDVVRAKAIERSRAFLVEPGNGGGIFDGVRTALTGNIVRLPDGRLQCSGNGDIAGQNATVLAYYIP